MQRPTIENDVTIWGSDFVLNVCFNTQQEPINQRGVFSINWISVTHGPLRRKLLNPPIFVGNGAKPISARRKV